MKHLNLRHEDTTSEDTLTEILEALAAYEDIGLDPGELFQAKNIAIVHVKESLKENDRAIRRARMLGIDATEIRQASAEMEKLLLLFSTSLDI